MPSEFSAFAVSWQQTIPGTTLFKQPLSSRPRLGELVQGDVLDSIYFSAKSVLAKSDPLKVS